MLLTVNNCGAERGVNAIIVELGIEDFTFLDCPSVVHPPSSSSCKVFADGSDSELVISCNGEGSVA